jgi:hypothetical protein
MLTYPLRVPKMRFIRVNPGDVQKVSEYALIVVKHLYLFVSRDRDWRHID